MTNSLGIEAIQKRPGMYVGPTADGTGLHNMVYRVVHCAIDTGEVTSVNVHLNRDGSCKVRDNGRGLSTDPYPKLGVSLAEAVMTNLWASVQEFAPMGVDLIAVNALSEWLDVRIWRNRKEHQMRFRSGKIEMQLHQLGDTEEHGTEISFLPSAKYFPETKFDPNRLQLELRKIALERTVTIAYSQSE